MLYFAQLHTSGVKLSKNADRLKIRIDKIIIKLRAQRPLTINIMMTNMTYDVWCM